MQLKSFVVNKIHVCRLSSEGILWSKAKGYLSFEKFCINSLLVYKAKKGDASENLRHFVCKNYFFGRWGSGFGVCFFEIDSNRGWGLMYVF